MSASSPFSRDGLTRIAFGEPSQSPLILDRYRVLGVMGSGGMGTVYRAYHVSLQRYVAIKTLRPEYIAKRSGLVQRFLREMAAIGQLDHPNVVRATDAGETNGVLHLVMDYLKGSDLGQIASDRGALRPADACELIRQAAVGLAYIHGNMIHRDIKPSNLMLTDAGVVKVLDLGLARLHEWGTDHAMTPQGCVLGTYDFMAPEQAAGRAEVDGRADIYSLGCTFFRLLTGQVPFGGDDYASSAQKILAHQQTPIEGIEGFTSIPVELRPIVSRMTAKDPSARYADAADVAAALAPFARGSEPAALVRDSSHAATESTLTELHRRELALLTHSPPTTMPFPRGGAPTPEETPTVDLRPKPPAPMKRRLVKVGAAGFAATALLACAFFIIAPGTIRGIKPTAPDMPAAPELPRGEQLSVDHLQWNKKYSLLLQSPVSLTGTEPGPQTWSYDADAQRVEVKHPYLSLLQTGATTSHRYTLEASISQMPWTGNTGIYWGYREYPNAAKIRETDDDFGSFECLYLVHNQSFNFPTFKQDEHYIMRRSHVTVFQNKHKHVCMKNHYIAEHVLARVEPKPYTLLVEVERNHLWRAVFGGIELNDLVARRGEADCPVNADVKRDGFGIFGYGHTASIDGFQFMSSVIPTKE